MSLTDASIRSRKAGPHPIKLTDGRGLYLEVRPTGAKLWRYRYRIGGKENVFAIGEYFNDRRAGHVSLDEARRERDKARLLVKQGVHPAHQRNTKRMAMLTEAANTFESVASEWIESKKAGWTAYYAGQVERFLRTDAFPYIGRLPVRSVTAAHLLETLRRIEARDATTVAILGRQWYSAIFRYAVATLRADADPAAALKGAISRPRITHSKALSRVQLQTLLNGVSTYGGYRTTGIALRVALLTFTRTIELRAARWDEINFERAEWRIPAARMKMGEEHIVPLSRQAIDLLRELHTLTGDQQWLFPNYRRPTSYMTATTLNRALERIGFNGKGSIGFAAHGFRATASTLLNEAGFRADVIERQLAHKERNKVRASYNHAEYLRERRAMMQRWADMVTEIERHGEGAD